MAANLPLEILSEIIEVPLPDEIGGVGLSVAVLGKSITLFVAVLGGCLCVIVNYQTTNIDV